jgi:hypothetical protein
MTSSIVDAAGAGDGTSPLPHALEHLSGRAQNEFDTTRMPGWTPITLVCERRGPRLFEIVGSALRPGPLAAICRDSESRTVWCGSHDGLRAEAVVAYIDDYSRIDRQPVKTED